LYRRDATLRFQRLGRRRLFFPCCSNDIITPQTVPPDEVPGSPALMPVVLDDVQAVVPVATTGGIH
jgi:hypothetical protein